MKIRLNENKEIVKQIAEGLIAKGGYCPCRVGKLPENKCMCAEFRAQLKDPSFEGYCHCGLFYVERGRTGNPKEDNSSTKPVKNA